MPASAAGSAVMMMKGSSQDWKFTTISRYTSTIANTSPYSSPVNEEFIVSICPRTISCEPLGRSLRAGVDDLVHVVGDAAQIAALHRAVDVDDRLHVAMADHGTLGAAVDA